MADYFNPQSLNPGTAFKPDGFLGGYIWGEDRQRYNQMAPLQDFMEMMKAQEQQNKMRDYGLEEPVRAAKREEEIAKSRATTDTIGRQKVADVQKVELENDLSSKTLASKVRTAAAEAAIKEGEAGGAKLKKAIEMAQMYAQAAKNGPAAIAVVDQLAKQMGMADDPMIETFKQNPQILGPLVQGLIEASADWQKEMAKIREKGKEDRLTENVRGANQRALEQERQKKRNKEYEQLLREAKKDEDVLRLWQIMTNDPEIEPALLNRAKAAAEQADKNLRAKDAARMPPSFPGMPQQTPQSRIEDRSPIISNPDPLGLFK